jgi:hypothetical protein
MFIAALLSGCRHNVPVGVRGPSDRLSPPVVMSLRPRAHDMATTGPGQHSIIWVVPMWHKTFLPNIGP